MLIYFHFLVSVNINFTILSFLETYQQGTASELCLFFPLFRKLFFLLSCCGQRRYSYINIVFRIIVVVRSSFALCRFLSVLRDPFFSLFFVAIFFRMMFSLIYYLSQSFQFLVGCFVFFLIFLTFALIFLLFFFSHVIHYTLNFLNLLDQISVFSPPSSFFFVYIFTSRIR